MFLWIWIFTCFRVWRTG